MSYVISTTHTLDGVRVVPGLLVWDYNLDVRQVGERFTLSVARPDGPRDDPWYEMYDPVTQRRGSDMNPSRMWRFHPTTGKPPFSQLSEAEEEGDELYEDIREQKEAEAKRVAATPQMIRDAVLTVRFDPSSTSVFAPWLYEMTIGDRILAGRGRTIEQAAKRASVQLFEYMRREETGDGFILLD